MNAATANTVYTRYNEISLGPGGILYVRVTEACEIDLDEVKACFEAYEQLGLHEHKAVQMLDVRLGVTMTKEARDYASAEGKKYLLATAVLSRSLSVRLIVNFINRFYAQPVPMKMFASETDALKWLQKFKG